MAFHIFFCEEGLLYMHIKIVSKKGILNASWAKPFIFSFVISLAV
jgi:hypothetical protein